MTKIKLRYSAGIRNLGYSDWIGMGWMDGEKNVNYNHVLRTLNTVMVGRSKD